MDRIRNWLIQRLGGQVGSNTPPALSQAPSQSQSSLQQNNNTPSSPILSTASAQIAQLSDRVDAMAGIVDKHHDQQNNVVIGAVFATVLIVAATAAEVIIFNAQFNNSLNQLQSKQDNDYKSLQDEANRTRDTLNQEMLQLKTSQ